MRAVPVDQDKHDQQHATYRAVLAALDQMGEGLVIVSRYRFLFVNDAFCRLCGFHQAELLAMDSFLELLYSSERDKVLQIYRNSDVARTSNVYFETALRHRNGERIAVEFAATTMTNGGQLATVIAVRDIRARKRAEEELRLHRDRLAQLVEERTAELIQEQDWAHATLESVGDAVITTDPMGLVSYLNPAAEHLIGYTPAEALGRPLAELFTIVDEDSGLVVPNLLRLGQQQGAVCGLNRLSLRRACDGEDVSIRVSIAPIYGRTQTRHGFVVVLHDVSEQRALSQLLSHQATHDALTGLLNRHGFEQRLQHLVDDAATNQRTHALFYLDLDQFKVVNDTCGHVAGDELLRQVGQLLHQRLRRGDTLARLGGDEFGVLLEHCPREEAVRVAEALLQALQAFRFTWSGQSFTVSACIGVVELDAHIDGATAALRAADTACFMAKDKGRNRIHLFHSEDAELNRRQGEMQWVTRITQALEEDRFCLYYQPIVALDAADSEQHWEILLRLKTPDGSIVRPETFIPAAERYNLMPAIDRWVIRNVIAWCARRLEAAPHQPLPLCGINLSGVSFSDHSLVGFIRDTLRQHDVPAANLCFEITETAAITNISDAVQFILELKELGCRFALDDFGSGMSSFAYLKNLPVDFLKIDGHFVRDIVDDPVDHVMVEAINRVGQAMGIRTIAEYVENDAIRAKLAQLGVDFAQGYGIAYPRPIHEADLAPL